jgi:hypothetical protein
MLTAAVRDLHLNYPGEFLTDVRTSCPGLWTNNPKITLLSDLDPRVDVVDCMYPLINSSNILPFHFIHGFIDFLSQCLGINIRPTAFKGDIHLSDDETSWISQIHEITNEDTPFWIIAAGGKYDYTIKWWSTKRYQEVVNHFKNRICFVQVGEKDHHHPALDNVIDLRGKTDLRQLVRLMYHAEGVLTPVSFLMHLSAAVPVKSNPSLNRPCVVVAGGREPTNWEAYPSHQFIHTIGALPCCATGGCWKSRVKALGDGDEKDKPENLCVNVVDELPRCMDMITTSEVIRRIETYYKGGILKFHSFNSNFELTKEPVYV